VNNNPENIDFTKKIPDELVQFNQKQKLQNKVLKRIVDKLNDEQKEIPKKTAKNKHIG
jgi:cell division protein FtsB